MVNVTTWSRSKPGFMERMRSSVPTSRAAPIRISVQTATCATTIRLRGSRRRVVVRPASQDARDIGPRAAQGGRQCEQYRGQQCDRHGECEHAQINVDVHGKRLQDRRPVANRRQSVNQQRQAGASQQCPPAPPSNASSRPSVSSCRTMRAGLAPRARRMPIS